MIKKIISFILNTFFHLFPIDTNKIVFQATRYQVTDNPYYIYKYIKENALNYKTIFIVERNADVSLLSPGDYAYVRTLKAYYHLATYKYLFTCQSLGSVIKKRPEQIYIQLWHGIALKKMGLDVQNNENLSRLDHTRDWDWLVSSSEYEASTLKSSSGCTCDIKILGNPRTDALYEKKDTEKIKRNLGITGDKKIVLYAPTFRVDELLKEKIELELPSVLSENFTLIIKLHPYISEKINNESLPDGVINASNYLDINDLIDISDIVITDYSSVFFDSSLMNKPTVFYAYDYEKYAKERNGFYLDYKKDLPGPVAYTKEELERIFLNIDENIEKYSAKLPDFNKKFNFMNDGKVCKRISDELNNGGFDK